MHLLNFPVWNEALHGVARAGVFLKEHTDICDEIEKQVRIHYHLLPDEEGQAKEPVPATGDAPDASEE